jgi:DNA invertase Pin-like site-specific DNA recombinase
MKPVRCAIYTRKSSDEGLEQSFNSLDAQREACGAYILSQASEGWTALPDVYDDGGLSGGTLERPALKRLLADVAAGQVDIIVVYKVDRLTRSLFDFAKLVKLLDRANTSFVSVTQSFNTTTSMGRLTLNMLLSFAQFEREVTAERIRDKIAASKARGMWMGGNPPLGYAPNGRSLTIVDDHAALIRDIYARYLRLGSVRLLESELATDKVLVPPRTTIGGKAVGGVPFGRGYLYQLLGNVIYAGQIGHKGKTFPGQHQAIIDASTFAAVQALRLAHRQGSDRRTRAAQPSLLAGKIVDASGEPLIATHANKGRVRHRYYVSKALQEARCDTGMRLPAREIETLVIGRLLTLLDDPIGLAASANFELVAADVGALHRRCTELAATFEAPRSQAVRPFIHSVRVAPTIVTITVDSEALATTLGVDSSEGTPPTFPISVAARLTRSGRVLRLVQDNAAPRGALDHSLIRLLVQARRWWTILRVGEINTAELARREGVTPSYLTRVTRLAFLSPAVTTAVLAGRQQPSITVRHLTLDAEIPADWQKQAAVMLAPGAVSP